MKKSIVLKFLFPLLTIVGLFLVVQFVAMPRLREMAVFGGTVVLVNFHEHNSLDADDTQVVFGGHRLRDENSAWVEYRGGLPRVYLNADFLQENIDPFVFWDAGAEVLFISSIYEMLEFSPGSEYFLVNGSPHPIENGIIHRNGEIFVPISIVHGLYPLIVEYEDQYNIVVVTDATAPHTTATVSSDTYVHFWPGSRPVAAELGVGETLTVFPGEFGYEHGEDSDFARVRTKNGLVGYVRISHITNLHTETPILTLQRNTILESGFINNNIHAPMVWQGNEPVHLIWESATNHDANVINMQTPLHPSINVVSPTWFHIDEAGERLISVASQAYVEWAHAQGVQVWPLVFDAAPARVRTFLMNREARRDAVNLLVDYAERMNFDGINIDFEHLMRADEGPYKLQFLRELAVPMRERGIVLSAAVKVPIPTNAFYRRDLIAKTVDFLMLMAYDEHWTTSPVAGPNASLPWVRRAVENMLTDSYPEAAVPRERLILGLPFYNRIWRTAVSSGEVSHYRAMGTNSTRAFFAERGVEWIWDYEVGSYFGEVSAFEGGETVIFRVWLECGRSIRNKMYIYEEHGLAGAASWSRLFAIDEFWDVLSEFF